jgi:hypothetical protein
MLDFGFTISQPDMQREMLKEALALLNHNTRAKIPAFTIHVRKYVYQSLITSKGYKDIISSRFTADFGLEAGSESHRMNAIVDEIVQNVLVVATPYSILGNKIVGGIVVNLLVDDYSDILALPEAVVDTKKETLPWLDWTLNLGNQVVVDGYDLLFGDFPQARSKEAIMAHGGAWRVPPEISGTKDNNWITRAILGPNGNGAKFTHFIQTEFHSIFEV